MLPKDAEPLPDAALVMQKTRALNNWLHTNYTLDEVAEMDGLMFDIMSAMMKAEADARQAERAKKPKLPKPTARRPAARRRRR